MASYNVPDDLRYSKSHEWVKDLGKNKYRFGITDYAAKHLGDITYIELPEIDDSIDREESGCVIETVKSSEDVFNHISGSVCARNSDVLSETPEIANTDCYGKGWLYEIQAENADDFKVLMTAEEYEKYLEDLGD